MSECLGYCSSLGSAGFLPGGGRIDQGEKLGDGGDDDPGQILIGQDQLDVSLAQIDHGLVDDLAAGAAGGDDLLKRVFVVLGIKHNPVDPGNA